jgi:hypothetical protein
MQVVGSSFKISKWKYHSLIPLSEHYKTQFIQRAFLGPKSQLLLLHIDAANANDAFIKSQTNRTFII